MSTSMDYCSSEYDEHMMAAAIRAELAAEGLPDVSITNRPSSDVIIIDDSDPSRFLLEKTNTEIQMEIQSENCENEQVQNEENSNQISRCDTPLLITNDTSELKRKAIKKLFVNNNECTPGPSNVQRSGMIHEEKIAGLTVKLPILPYPNQKSLIDNLIKSLNNSKNCILESPTGTGKTLALLCGVLAWQEHMQRELEVSNAQMKRLMEELLIQNATSASTNNPEARTPSYMPVPSTCKQEITTPEKFMPNIFGGKNIYHKPEVKVETSPSNKRTGPYINDFYGESSGLVTIHKKGRYSPSDCQDISNQQVTPDKVNVNGKIETPDSIRQMNEKVHNIRIRSVPTIYYGARTHTQLQQVIKEFAKTSYCSQVKMTILSSRDKTCIKEFDKSKWSTRDEMCLACTKNNKKDSLSLSVDDKCEYFDNRISHNHLPNAFDIEDLIKFGKQHDACPYYSARTLVASANIVFCPYNYLIDPTIRESMQINLKDSVIVIDEAHNIENQCRDAASYSFTQDLVRKSLEELHHLTPYPFAIVDIQDSITFLMRTLKNWDRWFSNQIDLWINVKNASHSWTAKDFADTLEDFNIGYDNYHSFKSNSEHFVKRLRDDPRPHLGITHPTKSFLTALSTHLGYFFRNDRQHMNDFKPALQAVLDSNEYIKKSRTNRHLKVNSVSLHLYCLNPAIVMSTLHGAHCIALASGTLTPILGIAAELGTEFQTISCQAGIPSNKVWVGLVKGTTYNYSTLKENCTKERLGKLIASVCKVTPNGVLCFVSSYQTLDACIETWKENGLWRVLNDLKCVCLEKKNGNHEHMMKKFYKNVEKGALLFAVYRGKVSEGMDFKDHQARAVICVGIPYLNESDISIRAKIDYNVTYHTKLRQLPLRNEWLNIQAYRAINQALGRCIRHKEDWGAVLLVDERYTYPSHAEYLSKWVIEIIKNGSNVYSVETLNQGSNGLDAFMKRMKNTELMNADK